MFKHTLYFYTALSIITSHSHTIDPDALFAKAHYDQAASLYEQYIQHASVNYAQCLIALGLDEQNESYWRKAWPLFEQRLPLECHQGTRQPLLKPLYMGKDPHDCTILVRTEYGIGDTFTFIRYVKLLKQMGARKVIMLLQPWQQFLADMLRRTAYIDEIAYQDDPLPSFDYDVYIMSLPGLISNRGLTSTTPNTIYHADAPYLFADPHSSIQLDHTKINIALCWRAGKNPVAGGTRIIDRDIPLTCILDTFKDVPNVQFYSIAGSRCQPVRQSSITEHSRVDPHDIIADDAPHIIMVDDDKDKPFANTMAVIAQADAVISVDTGFANLAAAMGAHTFFLLKKEQVDMRWGTEGSTTPWYSSATLLRQEVEGDWSKPLNELKKYFLPYTK